MIAGWIIKEQQENSSKIEAIIEMKTFEQVKEKG